MNNNYKKWIWIFLILLLINLPGVMGAHEVLYSYWTTETTNYGADGSFSFAFEPNEVGWVGSILGGGVYSTAGGSVTATLRLFEIDGDAETGVPNSTELASCTMPTDPPGGTTYLWGCNFSSPYSAITGHNYALYYDYDSHSVRPSLYFKDASSNTTISTRSCTDGATPSGCTLYGTNRDTHLKVFYDSAPAPIPTITLNHPTNNLISNSNLLFNFTVTSQDADNCTLYGDWSGTWEANKSISDGTIGSHSFGVIKVGSYDGTHSWNVMCMEGGTEYWGASNFTFTIDLIDPNITLNQAMSDFDNNGKPIGNIYNETLRYGFDFADERDLYAYQINLTNINGSNMYYLLNQSLSGTTAGAYGWINVSNIDDGLYNLTVTASDSHTKQEIKAYETKASNKELYYKTEENIKIWIKSDDEADTSTIKTKDRYSFNFDFKDKLNKGRIFHVISDNPISYRKDSGYKAHFVITDGVDGNWVDFEGVPGTPIITRVNAFHYTVYFPHIPSKVEFHSIGGLNTNAKTYPLYIGNYNIHSDNGLIGEPHIFKINLTVNTGYILTNITGNFTYQNKTYEYDSRTVISKPGEANSYYVQLNKELVEPSVAGSYSYSWKLNIPYASGGEYTIYTENVSHNVVDWSVDNCTANSHIALTFKIRDENHPDSMLASITESELLGEYWINDKSRARNISIYYGKDQNTLNVCTDTEQVQIDLYLKYASTYGFTHRYFLYNKSIFNTSTETYNIYNFNKTDGISQLRITSRYSDTYNYFINAIVGLERLYPSSNDWRTVQMGKTDDYGFVGFNIIEREEDYRLVYRDTNNNLLKVTDALTFACDNGVCSILALLSPYAVGLSENNVTYSYTYDNLTHILSITWLNGAEADISIGVFQETPVSTNELFNYYETNSLTGTKTFNLSGYSGEIQLKLNTTREGSELLEHSKFINIGKLRLADYVGESEGAMFSFLLLIVISMMGVWSPVAVIISTLLGLFVIYIFGLVSAISLGFLITATIVGLVLSLKLKQ